MFFSEIKTVEVTKPTINTTVSTQESEKAIIHEVIVEEKILTAHDSRLTTPKPKRELPKSSSIGNMLKDIHQEVVVENKETKIVLTAESLAVLWNEFIKKKI